LDTGVDQLVNIQKFCDLQQVILRFLKTDHFQEKIGIIFREREPYFSVSRAGIITRESSLKITIEVILNMA